MNSILHQFPLNVMYWSDNGDGTYEMLDGQQRTISICQYLNGDFSLNYQYFHNLTQEEQQQILDYKLMIYICKGTDTEKLDWFKIINIAGEKLTEQELRNAIYTGEWLSDAKKYFSKNQCIAYKIGERYNEKGKKDEKGELYGVPEYTVSYTSYMPISPRHSNPTCIISLNCLVSSEIRYTFSL